MTCKEEKSLILTEDSKELDIMEVKKEQLEEVIEFIKTRNYGDDIVAIIEQLTNNDLRKGFTNNPTSLAKIISTRLDKDVSAQKVNIALINLKLQLKENKNEYIPTIQGNQYSERFLICINNRVKIQLKWADEVIDILVDYFTDSNFNENSLNVA